MQELGNEFRELLEDVKVLLYVRNGIFQARIYKGERSYLYRSLKTNKLDEARKAALKLAHIVEYKQEEGLPLTQHSLSQVIDEYIEFRDKDYKQSLLTPKTASTERRTSIYMLRQIKRVAKFWREYCGNVAVDKIDNAMLRDYIPWRKEYYHVLPEDQRPRNFKINPADKTLQWEMMLGKALIKYAHERGYRGKTQLPKFTFTAKKKIVRPPFTRQEFSDLLKFMRKWVKGTTSEKYRYARVLLQSYVLILSDTGMRVGEANNLQWRDLSKCPSASSNGGLWQKTAKSVLPSNTARRPLNLLKASQPLKWQMAQSCLLRWAC